VQDRQFFFKNPVADMVAVQSLTASSSSGSSNNVLPTLLMASMLDKSNNQRPRRSHRYVPPPPRPSRSSGFVQSSVGVSSGGFVQAAPVAVPVQGFQGGFSAPATFQGGFVQGSQGGFVQPTFVAPPPPTFVQGGFQGGFSGRSSGFDPRYEEERDDPLKKAVLLSSITSGKINPLTAVAMDRNQGMGAAETVLVSSLGDSASTLVALSGGFGGTSGSSQGGLFGSSSSRGGSSTSNLLQTMVVANALAPKKEGEEKSNDGASTLAAFALLSNMQNSGDDGQGSW
jgi:hypothetical protein